MPVFCAIHYISVLIQILLESVLFEKVGLQCHLRSLYMMLICEIHVFELQIEMNVYDPHLFFSFFGGGATKC